LCESTQGLLKLEVASALVNTKLICSMHWARNEIVIFLCKFNSPNFEQTQVFLLGAEIEQYPSEANLIS
jgi:hypothetical protein